MPKTGNDLQNKNDRDDVYRYCIAEASTGQACLAWSLRRVSGWPRPRSVLVEHALPGCRASSAQRRNGDTHSRLLFVTTRYTIGQFFPCGPAVPPRPFRNDFLQGPEEPLAYIVPAL
jgi:hypothetical protein